MNTQIWYDDSQVSKGQRGANNYMLTNGFSNIRNAVIIEIMEIGGGIKVNKVDCLEAEFKDCNVSW
mgnify:CR=1 FL=1|tara:strand:+ start:703 stop:900 length:198 start_codon:yes stop_codon:yes gene_type:complete